MENLLQAKANNKNNKRLPEALVVILINSLICTVVAVLVWAGFPNLGKHGLFSTWVYSQSIGQIICIAYLAMGYYLRSSSAHPLVTYGLVTPIIILFGFFLGKYFAAWILNEPTQPQDNNSIFWTTLVVTAVVATVSLCFYAARHRVITLKMFAAEEAVRASDAKLSMLQAQVEPHMLFNTLSNLKYLIDSDPQKAKLMLDHLVEFLRATLSGSMQEKVTLKDEYELLENYLSLMQIRMGERLSFELELPSELEAVSIPALALQPLVENSIKHGLEPSLEGGHICVTALADAGFVVIKVVDNGIGFDVSTATSVSGFGLQSVRERIEDAQNELSSLSVVSPVPNSDKGTLITVQFPIVDE